MTIEPGLLGSLAVIFLSPARHGFQTATFFMGPGGLTAISHPIISDPFREPDREFVTVRHDSPGSRAFCPVALYRRRCLDRVGPRSRMNPAVTSLRTPTVGPPRRGSWRSRFCPDSSSATRDRWSQPGQSRMHLPKDLRVGTTACQSHPHFTHRHLNQRTDL